MKYHNNLNQQLNINLLNTEDEARTCLLLSVIPDADLLVNLG